MLEHQQEQAPPSFIQHLYDLADQEDPAVSPSCDVVLYQAMTYLLRVTFCHG